MGLRPFVNASATLFAIAGAWAIYRRWAWKRSLLAMIPSPPEPSVLFGQFFYLVGGRAGELFTKWILAFGNVIAFDMFLAGTRVMICDADAIKRVLVANMSNYPKRGFLRHLLQPLVGQGLMFAEGDCHKRQRKIISDAFRYDNMIKLSNHFAMQAEQLVEFWLKSIHSATASCAVEIDIKQTMHDLTMDMIGITGFGYHFDSVRGQRTDLGAAYSVALSCSSLSLINTINHMWPFTLLPLPGVLKERAAHTLIRATVDDIIHKRRLELQAAAGNDEATARLHTDLLGLMLQAQGRAHADDSSPASPTLAARAPSAADSAAAAALVEPTCPIGGAAPTTGLLTDEEVRDNIITFLLLGHETTANNLSWTLYLLACHPTAADRVRAEVRRALRGEPRLPCARDLEAMPFLTAVIKESLRLYPPVHFSMRVALKQDSLAGYEVPDGQVLLVPIIVLHRHPDLWNRPNEFLPERFLPGSTIDRDRQPHPYKWCPFLAGPRACMGSRFAQLQVGLVVATLISRVRLALPAGHPEPYGLQGQVTLAPHPYLRLRISRLPEERLPAEQSTSGPRSPLPSPLAPVSVR